MQPPGGIDDHDVSTVVGGCDLGFFADLDRVRAFCRRVHRNVDLLPEHRQLFDGSRPVHIRRNEVGESLLPLQVKGQLGCRGRFSRSLQTNQHDDDRWRGRKIQLRRFAAHQLGSSSARTILMKCCSGVRLASTSWPSDCSRIRSVKSRDHLKVDVSFEQGEPHVAHRVLDVALGDLPVSAQTLYGLLELLGQ